MEVIKNNCLNTTEKQNLENIEVACENCGSILEVNNKDTHIGWLGMEYVTCPCCNKDTVAEEFEGIEITAKNVNYPTHFLYVDKDQRDVVHIDDEKINEYIQRGIEYLRINKDEYYWYTATGDCFVEVFRYEDDEEYYILVTNSYYESTVSFEEDDYT